MHHVMIRGIDGRAIFSAAAECEDFIVRLAFLVRKLGFAVLAWCLITNHAHLVLQSNEVPLALLMKRLNARHAQRHNRREARVGHVFQARYKAVLIENQSQLVATIPYVLGNAARHGLVTPSGSPDYRWSMHGALAGRRSPYEFEDVRAAARALGMELARLPALVERAASEAAAFGAALEPNQRAELDRLIRACCARHGVEREALRSRAPQLRGVRREICRQAASALDLSLSQISRQSAIPYDTVWRFARDRS